MASQMAILTRAKTLIKTLNPIKSISTYTFLSQEPQLATDPDPTHSAPLPPNPSSGSPIYSENWRSSPIQNSNVPLMPLGFLSHAPASVLSQGQIMDVKSLLNIFADWMTSQRWAEMKQLFQFWIRLHDKNGKPNKPDVNLYNHYLRANLMMGATVGDLLDLVTQMEGFAISPNTATYNLLLKSMYDAREIEAAQTLLQRMEQSGKEAQPDDESFDLITAMHFLADQTDMALKYVDKILKNGNMLSLKVFSQCVSHCLDRGKLDALVSIIEKCKTMDQNKALCPSWTMCNNLAEVAMQEDNSKLTFYALEFMAKLIVRAKNARPPVLLSAYEGLVVSALATAGRTYNSTLLDASWGILGYSLHQKKFPSPESYIAKIYAHASLGNLQKAFGTLREFESSYGSFDKELVEELFSPFSSLYPLAVACSKKGFETLDLVYFQLENLSRAERPYKSVAALNCIILGCANIWDLDRAYQTFEAIGSSFGLNPDIHSYNALMFAFGRLKKTFEASKVFEHLLSLGIKPNAMSYSLLLDAHLINRDPKAALSVIDEMVSAGFTPSKEALKKVRRRCIREMDYESDDRVESLARKFQIRMGAENRRDMLFNITYSTDYTS